METKYVLIIVIAIPIIFSYLFDVFSRKTKFPSVLLLIMTGIAARAFTDHYYDIEVKGYLDQIIPTMGTLGLILIVFEGALELEITKEKLKIIFKGLAAAFVVLLLNIIGLAWVFEYFFNIEHQVAVINAIPLSVISSAVAIPSATSLLKLDKEFVVYESTFSDILGIVAFYYTLGKFEKEVPLIDFAPLAILSFEIIGIIIGSIIITFLLFELIERLEHKVKFFLILAILILIYGIGKIFHLPALLTVFIFGLFLSNSDFLFPKFLRKYVSTKKAEEGLHEFHLLAAESTFIVRTFFFLIFGYSIVFTSLMEGMDYFFGVIILLIMLSTRFLYLVATQPKNISPLVFMSPRGLISILLFLEISYAKVPLVSSQINEKVLLIVILGSMLIMLIGTVYSTSKQHEEDSDYEEGDSLNEQIIESEDYEP